MFRVSVIFCKAGMDFAYVEKGTRPRFLSAKRTPVCQRITIAFEQLAKDF